MSTILHTAPSTQQIKKATAIALDAWQWTQYSWGTEWRFTDHLGCEHYVAHSEERGELEIYMSGGPAWDGLEAVVVFESWRTDADHVTTPGELATVLNDLGLPEVDA